MGEFLLFAKSRSENQEAIEVIALTYETAGLAGNWKYFETIAGFDTEIIYYFGDEVGRIKQKTERQTTEQYVLSESTLVFEYQLLSLNSFKARYTTVTQNTLVRDLKENAESRLDLGPVSYEEFVNTYSGDGAQVGAVASNNEPVNFSFSDDRKKMTLSTSQGSVELTRVK